MLPMQRREKIKAILREQKSVTVLELMEYFNVTNETIRRDLLALEEEGFVSRVHGGAYIEGGFPCAARRTRRRSSRSPRSVKESSRMAIPSSWIPPPRRIILPKS